MSQGTVEKYFNTHQWNQIIKISMHEVARQHAEDKGISYWERKLQDLEE